jgi:hypothetical protein
MLEIKTATLPGWKALYSLYGKVGPGPPYSKGSLVAKGGDFTRIGAGGELRRTDFENDGRLVISKTSAISHSHLRLISLLLAGQLQI